MSNTQQVTDTSALNQDTYLPSHININDLEYFVDDEYATYVSLQKSIETGRPIVSARNKYLGGDIPVKLRYKGIERTIFNIRITDSISSVVSSINLYNAEIVGNIITFKLLPYNLINIYENTKMTSALPKNVMLGEKQKYIPNELVKFYGICRPQIKIKIENASEPSITSTNISIGSSSDEDGYSKALIVDRDNIAQNVFTITLNDFSLKTGQITIYEEQSGIFQDYIINVVVDADDKYTLVNSNMLRTVVENPILEHIDENSGLKYRIVNREVRDGENKIVGEDNSKYEDMMRTPIIRLEPDVDGRFLNLEGVNLGKAELILSCENIDKNIPGVINVTPNYRVPDIKHRYDIYDYRKKPGESATEAAKRIFKWKYVPEGKYYNVKIAEPYAIKLTVKNPNYKEASINLGYNSAKNQVITLEKKQQ